MVKKVPVGIISPAINGLVHVGFGTHPQALSHDQVLARAARCKERNVCFISLAHLSTATVAVLLNHPVAGEVRVLSQYI